MSVYEEKNRVFRTLRLPKGSIVKADHGIYSHVGISDGDAVIHRTKDKNGVTKDSWDFFFDGAICRDKGDRPEILLAYTLQKPEIILLDYQMMFRAVCHIGQSGYCLVSASCQEFVGSCISGDKYTVYEVEIEKAFGKWQWRPYKQ